MASDNEILLTIKAETDKATKEVKQLKQEFNNLSKATGKSNKDFAGQEKALASLNGKMGAVTKTLAGLATAFLSFQGAKAFVSSMAEIEEGFVGIAKTTGATAEQMDVFKDSLYDMTSELSGISLTELQGIAEGAGQLGVANEDIIQFTESIAKISVATNLSASDASRDFAIIANVFGEPIENIEALGSAVNELSATTAGTVDQIISGTTRLANVGASFGFASHEILAFTATLADAGVRTEIGSSSLSQIFQKMQTDVASFAKVSGRDVEEFADLMRNDPVEAVTVFADAIGELSKTGDASKALKDMGLVGNGVSQTVLALANNTEKLTANMLTSKTAFEDATSVQIEYEKASQTINSKIKDVQNAFVRLSRELMVELEPALKEVLDGMVEFLDSFDKDKVTELGQAIVGVAGAFGALIKAVIWLNDIAIPDWLVGGEDIGLIDGAFGNIVDAINDVAEATEWWSNQWDSLTGASKELETQMESTGTAIRTASNFDSSAKNYALFDDAVDSLIQKNRDLIEEWKKKDPKIYADLIKELTEETDRLEKAQERLETRTPHTKDIESAKEAIKVEKELAEEVKVLSLAKAEELLKIELKRVTEYEKNLDGLSKAEAKIAKEIEALVKAHNERLKALDKERVSGLRESEFDILDIKRKGLKEYAKYTAGQLEADEQLAKARELLEQGKFDEAEAYFERYKQLIRESAGEEIKEGDKIRLSKEQTAEEAIADIEEEKKFIQEMYDAKKQAEDEAHKKSLLNKKAELDGIKAQIELQKQLIVLVNALIEALTGTTVKINTKEGTEAINALADRSKELKTELDELDGKSIGLKVNDGELTESAQNVREVKNTTSEPFTVSYIVEDGGLKESTEQIKENVAEPFKVSFVLEDDVLRKVGEAKADLEENPIKLSISDESSPDIVESVVDIKQTIADAPAIMKIELEDGTQASYIAIQDSIESNPATLIISGKDEAGNIAEESRRQIESVPALLKVTGDAGQFTSLVTQEVDSTNNQKATIKVGAETAESKRITEEEKLAIDAKTATLKVGVAPIEGDVGLDNIKDNVTNTQAKVTVGIESGTIDSDLNALKSKITAIKPVITFKTNLGTLISDLTKLNSPINSSLTITSNIGVILGQKSQLLTPTASQHTVTSNASAVRAELLSLNGLNTTSSHVHTITTVLETIQRKEGGFIPSFASVPMFNEGGDVQKFANGGYPIRRGSLGGYGGGDRIKALLEAGEFIQRKEAVKKYGIGFMTMVNSMKLPVPEAQKMVSNASSVSAMQTGGSVRRYAEGGEVAPLPTASGEVRNITLNFIGDDGIEMPVITEESTANLIENYLRRFSQ